MKDCRKNQEIFCDAVEKRGAISIEIAPRFSRIGVQANVVARELGVIDLSQLEASHDRSVGPQK
jgi:hypothetical protein